MPLDKGRLSYAKLAKEMIGDRIYDTYFRVFVH